MTGGIASGLVAAAAAAAEADETELVGDELSSEARLEAALPQLPLTLHLRVLLHVISPSREHGSPTVIVRTAIATLPAAS